MVRESNKQKRERGTGPVKAAKKSKMEKSSNLSCECGAIFVTKWERKRHSCKYLRARRLERLLKSLTSPGSECDVCGGLLLMDDVLYREKNVIVHPFDSMHMPICSDCAEQYEHPLKRPIVRAEEIEEYLQIRRSVAPFPWLEELKAKLFKELQEELYKPERVQKWLEAGHDLESYLN